MGKEGKNEGRGLNMGNITQKWVGVVKPFTKNYLSRLTATEISKLSKIPQQTVSRILNLFLKLNLIDCSIQGKNKLFYFKESKLTTYPVFTIVEGVKSLDFSINFPTESLIINKLTNCCEALILFGSYVSGKPRKDSDLDVVLLGKCDKKKIKDIKETSPIDIHEHFVSYKELKKLIVEKNPMILEIFDNHLLFGDVSRIINLFWRKNG